MRLFIAVNFDDTVRDAVRAGLDAFPVANPPWRWAAPETWHVTLKFLGETDAGTAAAVSAALEPVRARHASFPISLGKFGAFPDLRAPRVLFYRVETGLAPLSDLAGDVDRALAAAVGLEREARAFHAHATVARVKERLPSATLAALAVVPPLSHPAARVSSFDLMESRLGRTGASYSTVKRFALP